MGHLATACAFLLGPVLLAQDWPQWRGPRGDGHAPAQHVPLRWDRETHVAWRTPLARPGNGSPIVAAGRVFLTMAEDEGGKQRSLYCFDRADGRQLWVRTVAHGEEMPTHETNPHCSTTPACDGERVVVWHASAGLHAYSVDGDELWHADLGEFRHMWGHGTSPVLHGGHVVLHTGPGAQSFVAAFDMETGEQIWRTDEPPHLTPEQREQKRLAGSWCTPLVHRAGGRDLLLCGQPTRVVAYDAASGEIAWSCAGITSRRGDLTYSSPVVVGDVCFAVGGYVGPMLGVRVDGRGDVTETHRAWHYEEVMSNCASGVAVDGHVYIPDMGSFVRCVRGSDGETLWRKRVGRGNSWGSILHADGRLYMSAQNGVTYAFEPNSERLVVLAENDLGETTNATPAISDGELFVRTHEAIYCISDQPE